MICGTVAYIDLCPIRHISELTLIAVVDALRFDVIGICNDAGKQGRHLSTGQALIQHHIAVGVTNHDACLTQVICGNLPFCAGICSKDIAGQ